MVYHSQVTDERARPSAESAWIRVTCVVVTRDEGAGNVTRFPTFGWFLVGNESKVQTASISTHDPRFSTRPFCVGPRQELPAAGDRKTWTRRWTTLEQVDPVLLITHCKNLDLRKCCQVPNILIWFPGG